MMWTIFHERAELVGADRNRLRRGESHCEHHMRGDRARPLMTDFPGAEQPSARTKCFISMTCPSAS